MRLGKSSPNTAHEASLRSHVSRSLKVPTLALLFFSSSCWVPCTKGGVAHASSSVSNRQNQELRRLQATAAQTASRRVHKWGYNYHTGERGIHIRYMLGLFARYLPYRIEAPTGSLHRDMVLTPVRRSYPLLPCQRYSEMCMPMWHRND